MNVVEIVAFIGIISAIQVSKLSVYNQKDHGRTSVNMQLHIKTYRSKSRSIDQRRIVSRM